MTIVTLQIVAPLTIIIYDRIRFLIQSIGQKWFNAANWLAWQKRKGRFVLEIWLQLPTARKTNLPRTNTCSASVKKRTNWLTLSPARNRCFCSASTILLWLQRSNSPPRHEIPAQGFFSSADNVLNLFFSSPRTMKHKLARLCFEFFLW